MKKKNIVWIYALIALGCFVGVADWSAIAHEVAHEGGQLKKALELLIGALDAGSAVALALLAYFAYQEMKHDDDWITLVLRYPDGSEERVKDIFQREDCSRSELQGILGVIHGAQGRYQVPYMSSPELRAELKRIKTTNALELLIPLQEGDVLKEAIKGAPSKVNDELEGDERPLAFWNISHHPVEGWSTSQREAALALAPEADLIDVDFPKVDPQLSHEELYEEARRAVSSWEPRLTGERRVSCAMVAGEPVMCLYLVRELQARGVSCYSATTSRVVEEVEGEKRSRFTFVRFRAWPSLEKRS